ncbi:MAG: diguanylate cyclase [Pseudomonadota bacterium]
MFDFPRKCSLRRQIIVVFVLGFFLLIAAFISYMAYIERESLHKESNHAALGLAQSLAVSSRSWVLANDVAGMQEVIHAFDAYPELRHAMLLSRSGRVLAHSDEEKTGLFLTDATSRSLEHAPPRSRFLINTETMVDVAVPVMAGQRHIGWARVAFGRDRIIAQMRGVMVRLGVFSVLFTLLAFAAATLIANRLAARLGSLARVADGVQKGDFSVRANVGEGNDEVNRLADSFNRMLDALEKNERDLRAASRYTRSLIEANLDPLLVISPEGRITDVNHATEKATGLSREKLIGTDFAAYVTDQDSARKWFRKAFAEGFVTDYPLSLRHRDGHVTHALFNASTYRNDAGEVIGLFAAARDITERKQAEDRIRHMAQYDALTDLPNRMLFSDRMKQAILHARRARQKLAVMFLDLDRFKPINDNYGHETGDRVLQVVAKRLQGCVRKSDSVGRIGGDEFTVLLKDVENEAAALRVAGKIHHALCQPIVMDDKILSVAVSIGIAMFPEHGDNEIELSRHADYAMYYAKHESREHARVYQPYMNQNP